MQMHAVIFIRSDMSTRFSVCQHHGEAHLSSRTLATSAAWAFCDHYCYRHNIPDYCHDWYYNWRPLGGMDGQWVGSLRSNGWAMGGHWVGAGVGNGAMARAVVCYGYRPCPKAPDDPLWILLVSGRT